LPDGDEIPSAFAAKAPVINNTLKINFFINTSYFLN